MPRWLGIAYLFAVFPACGIVAASLLAGRITSFEGFLALGVIALIGLLHLCLRHRRSRDTRFDGAFQTGADGTATCGEDGAGGDCGSGGDGGGD